MPTPDAREDQQLWSEKAPVWDLHVGDHGDRNRRLHVAPVIWRTLGDVAGLDVLDAGCGTGYLSAKLAERGARVRAIDFAPGYYHRPLKVYWRAFRAAGLTCFDFDEPVLQPPYPPELSPEDLRKATQCAWSVAFGWERPRAVEGR